MRTTTVKRAIINDVYPILIYLRISNDPEGKAAGVTRQDEDCQAHAATVPGGQVFFKPDGSVYCDNDISASTNHEIEDLPRPDYDALLVHAHRLAQEYGRCMIIAWTSARLTRRVEESEAQIKLARRHGVVINYVKSANLDLTTADGRFLARINAAIDSAEPERTSELGIRDNIQRAQLGVWRGGPPPFGYRLAYAYDGRGKPILPGTLTVVPEEADAIRMAVDVMLAPARYNLPLANIGRMWTALGVAPHGGSAAWSRQGVRAILCNPALAGLVERHGEIVGPGQWDKIIEPDQLYKLRTKLGDPDRRTCFSRTRVWVGASLYRCGAPGCESSMRSSGGDYRCQNPRCGLKIPSLVTDTQVLAIGEGILDEHRSALLRAHAPTVDVKALHDLAAELTADLEMLATLHGQGTFTMAEWLAARGPKVKRLATVNGQLAQVADGSPLKGVADALDPVTVFRALSIERQRACLSAIMTITIEPYTGPRGVHGQRLTEEQRVWPRIRIDSTWATGQGKITAA